MPALYFEKEFLRKIEQMALTVRRLKAGRSQGLRRSPNKGNSVEFADFRNYVKGDDLRRLDWNAYARLDRLFLRLFVEEQDTTLYMLIDQSRSMTCGTGSKYRFAVRCAAALSYLALMGYDRAAVAFLSERMTGMFGPTTGQSAWMAVWDYLARNSEVNQASKTVFARSIHDFCSRRPIPGVCVLVSDLLSNDYESGLKSLQATGQEIVVLHVLSPEETNPEAQGEVKLVDSETAAEREVSLTPGIVRAYRKRLDEFCESIRQFCVQRGIAYIRVGSEDPIDTFIVHGLRSAGILH